MIINNPLKYFSFFFKFLRFRVLVTFFLSCVVGLLDGIGLALFIPLLKLVSDSESTSNDDIVTDFVVSGLNISPSLLNILLLIFFFFSLKGVIKFIENYTRVIYQQYFMRKIRISNIDLFNHFDFLRFAKTDMGRIQNSFSGEVGRVNTAFRFYFKGFQYGALVLVYVGMAFVADIRFTLMVVFGGMATNFLFQSLYKRTKFLSRKFTQQGHVFEGLLIQLVSQFKYLKTTGLNFLYSGKLKENIYDLEKTQRRLGVVDSLLYGLREPLVILVVIVAIYLQVKLFNQDIGIILLSLLLLYRALTFFMAMQEQRNMFLGVSGSLENMEEFTKELRKGKEVCGKKEYSGFRNSLKFKNLFFSYGGHNVLRNINLEIKKNETFAVVGESGAGKSTFLNLVSGLFLPTRGKFKIDGKAINEIDLRSYRRKIGYVSQDAVTFNDSIYNNVTLWDEKTPEKYKKFLQAIERAAISEFMMELPRKEETYLGNNGINLSGGQKQRLSIARELYKDIDILLMDEATSALDSETEALVQLNVNDLKGSFTIIVIAHRLATIKNADRIMLLNKGEIEAIGPFEQLLKSSEHFNEMVKLQNL
ncbi:MAG: ABC transporter ATP-binding protein [Bacteroidota bacterium]